MNKTLLLFAISAFTIIQAKSFQSQKEHKEINNEKLISNKQTLATYTNIPDPNFEQALIDLGLDSGSRDGKVITANISSRTSLNLDNKNISDLTGIEDFVSLKTLSCRNNKLTTLNLIKNIALTSLYCDSNQLTDLNISTNINLGTLYCKSNLLATLNVTKNTLLTELYCDSNQLTALNINFNTNLNYLKCDSNQLTNFNVSKNTALIGLYCNSNQLTTLDVTKNTVLKYFYCNSNKLINLNIKNKNNSKITTFDVTDNPDLLCILADNTSPPNSGWKKSDQTIYNTASCDPSDYITIPDTNFEQALIDLGIDIGNDGIDGKVLISRISNITSLNISNKNISNLTGIEFFRNLMYLYCDQNQLENLDLSKNTALNYLDCNSNQLTILDVAKNTTLDYLDCSSNQITILDTNIALKTLNCSFNRLVTLDITKNIILKNLNCKSNQIINLNLSNGSLNDITTFDSTDNPDLTCIKVETTENISGKDWKKNIYAYYSTSICPAPVYTLISDPKFEEALINLGYDNVIDGHVLTARIANVTSLDVSNKSITDLTGIKDFTVLKELTCDNNQLTNLDLSKNTVLTDLYCSGNILKTLNLMRNTTLTTLNCSSNKLTSLDLTKNIILNYLDANSNQLTSLNLINNPELHYLNCNSNQLITLNVTNNNLYHLDCSSNSLTILDLTKNKNLVYVYCYLNKLTTLDLSKSPFLTDLNCNSNQLINLNISNRYNRNITSFIATNNLALTCIQADSTTPPNSNWDIDFTAKYSTTACTPLSNTTFDINDNLILIYPNPTTDVVDIILPIDTELKLIEVYSQIGQKVKTTTQSKVSLKNLTKGMYFLIIETNTGNFTKKVIKN